MNRTTILAVGAAVLLIIGGLPAATAAAPGNAPVDQDDADADTNSPSVGPSGGLPGPVPDFVSGIHDTITSFRNGDIENLGKSLSELLGDQTPADDMRGGPGA